MGFLLPGPAYNLVNYADHFFSFWEKGSAVTPYSHIRPARSPDIGDVDWCGCQR